MERRLGDRIRTLCDAAIECRDIDQLYIILEELREALREHVHRVRTLAEAKLVAGLPLEERRHEIRQTFKEMAQEAAA